MALDADARTALAPALRAPRHWDHVPWTQIVLGLAALVCALPAIAVLLQTGVGLANGAGGLDRGLMQESVLGSVFLILVGAGAATALGAAAALLVHGFHFPGRTIFSWLLVTPLAAPAYVLAYAYGGLTGPLGPVPLGLSGLTGAAFVYTLAFFPYAYLSTRAALAAQSVCAMESARSLGASPLRILWRITLPMAWPGIAAGAALAAMEIAADYGAAAYFGAQTLATGVFRAWYAHSNPALAIQIASILLVGAGALLLLERHLRGKRRFSGGSTRWRNPPATTLPLPLAAAASAFCAALVALGAVIPALWLMRLASYGPADQLYRLWGPMANTLGLGLVGTIATILIAGVIALGARGRNGGYALTVASIGYAAPGAVMALGGLMVMGAARDLGLVGGLGAAAALAMLIWIYAARFAAAGAGPMDAGLNAATANYLAAAQTLGANRVRRAIAVEAPIAAPSVMAAALIVFVEIIKELPATLILRPFDFDTLAVVTHSYAADDRLNAAALPALMIFAAGLAPVIVLTTGLARARAGAH